jgi:PASTA domain
MGRFGSFVPRLIALTVVWLLATAALTFAAAQRIGTTPAATTSTQASVSAQRATLVVPDVRGQAFVFAKGTLGDAGFSFRVDGSVHGFASNLVVAQVPIQGTRVIDTGAPTIVLRLSRSGKEMGAPENISGVPGTAVRLADLAVNPAPAPATKASPAKKAAPTKQIASVPKKAVPAKQAPKQRWPQHRPPAFVIAGARAEPLDEMPLTERAQVLLTWVDGSPRPTNANVHRWLFQHSWIVTGAQMGWWHGAEALKTLETVDQKVWKTWGIGARSNAAVRQALAEVKAKS